MATGTGVRRRVYSTLIILIYFKNLIFSIYFKLQLDSPNDSDILGNIGLRALDISLTHFLDAVLGNGYVGLFSN